MKKKKRLEIIECSGTMYKIGKQYGAVRRNSLVTSIKTLFKE